LAKNNNGKNGKKAAPIVVTAPLQLVKETKNTFRFDADESDPVQPVISSLYIAKRAFGKNAEPQRVTKITVEWE
jgi:hypothetical protein